VLLHISQRRLSSTTQIQRSLWAAFTGRCRELEAHKERAQHVSKESARSLSKNIMSRILETTSNITKALLEEMSLAGLVNVLASWQLWFSG